jgi:3-hydroxyacyl-[acyl-carrier-protein] dehydratase
MYLWQLNNKLFLFSHLSQPIAEVPGGSKVSFPKEKDKFLRQAARQPLWLPASDTESVHLGRPDLERLIPHRDPFLLLDAITAVDYEQQALAGVRRINPDDPVLAGHFPGNAIYPGVLQIEMMGQLGLCWIELHKRKNNDAAGGVGMTVFRLMKIYDAIFLAPVLPGDELTVRTLILEDSGFTLILAGQISRGETCCSATILEVYYV